MSFPFVRRAAFVLVKTKRLLAVESDGSHSEDKLRDLKAALSWAAVDEVRVLRRIPVDRRHNAKVNYPQLMRLLQ
jgi:hypothetical protein